MHDCERRCSLHDFAERHRVVQEFWRAKNDRQDRRYVTASLRDNRSPHALDANVSPRSQYRPEGLGHATALFIFAFEQRDTFAVFAHAGQQVTVLCLSLVLVLRYRDQAASDDKHAPSRHHRINHRRNNEEASNGDGRVMNMERKRAADCPQNCDKRRCR